MTRIVGLIVLVALLAVAGTSAVAQEKKGKVPDTGTAIPGVLKVGLIPSEDARAMIRQSKAVMEELAKHLDLEVIPFVATDYNGVIEALRARHIDVAYLGPFSYVLGTTVAPIEAFAVAVTARTGTSYYQSVIIARKESRIKKLEDIKGRTFAFVDPSSTSGHLVPKTEFLKLGIVPEKDFAKVVFSGAHDASIVAVFQKKVDAAAVADRIYGRGCAKGLANCDELEIVHSSARIPESPMVWRKDLPDGLKAKLRAAFAEIRNMSWTEQGVVAKFEPTTDDAYDPIRDIAKLLDLDLKKLK